MKLLELTITEFQVFILVFSRVATLFFVAPVFSSRNIPVQLKIGFSLVVAFAIFPLVQTQAIPGSMWSLAFLIFKELLLGFILGSLTYFLFVAIQLGGQIIDMQMGFGIANVIDPLNGTEVSITAQFYYLLALLLFLSINGHHYLIIALVRSFTLVPLGGFQISYSMFQHVLSLSGEFFAISLQIVGPIIIVLFLTNVTLGILSRTMPQLNILMVGMPINIFAGLLTILFTLSMFSTFFQLLLEHLWGDLSLILHQIK